MNQWEKNKLYNRCLDISTQIREIQKLDLPEAEKKTLERLKKENQQLYCYSIANNQ